MNRLFLIIGCVLGLLCCDPVAAQETTSFRRASRTTLFGVGGARQQDTYLSPLNYRGLQLNFLFGTQRVTHLLDSCVTFQTLLQADFTSTTNAPEKATYLGGVVHFDAAWHYSFCGSAVVAPSALATAGGRSFRLLLGPQVGASFGGLYNTRNGNNPAQAIAEMHLSASAAFLWRFRLWKQPLVLSDQMDIPLIGMMFSPAYGQSYYEIFTLGNRDHNICLTTPFNAPTLRNQLAVDLPFRRCTLRLAYLADFRQSRTNEIRRHTYSHAFLIGWVRQLDILRPRPTPAPSH